MEAKERLKTEVETYGSTLSDLGASFKHLVQSEIHLVTAEVKESMRELSKHATQAAIFGSLLMVSALPFIAFAVIGLGELMNDNYWLSSLIVAVICAGVGGIAANRAYKKIKEDLTFPKSRQSLEHEAEVVADRGRDLKDRASENVSAIKDATKRRAV